MTFRSHAHPSWHVRWHRW